MNSISKMPQHGVRKLELEIVKQPPTLSFPDKYIKLLVILEDENGNIVRGIKAPLIVKATYEI